MNEHFIKNIEIDNFKCFNGFKAEGFKRVNLIGGKNNVGKTAFMEACYINTYKYTATALSKVTLSRYKIDILTQFNKGIGTDYIHKYILEKINQLDKGIIKSNLKRTTINLLKELSISNDDSCYFIDGMKLSPIVFEDIYSEIMENGLEKDIDIAINIFDNSVDTFRFIKSQPKCRLKASGKFQHLNELGDGLYKYIVHLTLFLSLKNGIVFIDEIENGIHYTKLDDMWRIILELSKDNNVQVFATTHSKECIESFARVSKELEDENISFVELGKDDKSNINAMIYPYEWFLDEIEQENEVRGW